MTVFAAMGIVITSATAIIYGKEIWDPIELAGKFENRLVVAIAMFTVVVATLSVNIAANVVSPANDFANAFPRKISFKTGGLITGIIGILMQPWRLLEDPDTYLKKWLGGYGAGLGSIAAVLVVDYWILRKRQLSLRDLYLPDGAYTYASGWNWRAAAATVIGTAVAFLGFFLPDLSVLADWSWFIGFGLAGGLYWVFNLVAPPPAPTTLPEARVR